MYEEFDVDYNSLSHASDALLLQFRKPLVRDLCIPDALEIYRLVKLATRVLSGESISLEDAKLISKMPNGEERLASSDILSVVSSSKLGEALFESLDFMKGKDLFLEDYLDGREDKFGNELLCVEGSWFRFRAGVRENLEEKARNFWNSEELKDFEKIGNAFQPYLELTTPFYRRS